MAQEIAVEQPRWTILSNLARHSSDVFPNLETQQDNRARILDAAASAFREKGYRASIDDIAARAGVVRQTVYNHFERKELLFRDVIRNAVQSILVNLEVAEGDLRESLVAFAAALRAKALGSDGVAMFRAIVAEAPRFPELASSFFHEGPDHTAHTLAAFLAKAMEAGKLRRDDPLFAAEMLLGMLLGHDRMRGLFNLETGLGDDTARIEKIIDCFLHAYKR